MPLDEHIEGGYSECQARLKISPAPMHHLLQMADQRQHREHRLHQRAVLPFPALTQFEVAGIPLGRMEGGITQDNPASVKLANEPLEGVIRDIHGDTRPPHNKSLLIEQQTEFPADNPTMIREAFPANLFGTPAFAHGVDELDAIRVDDAEDGRSCQEDLRPVLMRLEETKEPGALGEAGK